MSYRLELYDIVIDDANQAHPEALSIYSKVINAAFKVLEDRQSRQMSVSEEIFNGEIAKILAKYNAKQMPYEWQGHALYYTEFETEMDAIRFKLEWS